MKQTKIKITSLHKAKDDVEIKEEEATTILNILIAINLVIWRVVASTRMKKNMMLTWCMKSQTKSIAIKTLCCSYLMKEILMMSGT